MLLLVLSSNFFIGILQKVLNSQNLKLKQSKDKLEEYQKLGKGRDSVIHMEKPVDSGDKYEHSSWQGSFAPLRKAVSVAENMCSWTESPTKLPDIQVGLLWCR